LNENTKIANFSDNGSQTEFEESKGNDCNLDSRTKVKKSARTNVSSENKWKYISVSILVLLVAVISKSVYS